MLRLGVARVDVVMIHDVDAHSQGSEEAAERAFTAATAGAYPALVELKRAGAIRAIGIGLNQVRWALRWLAEADLDCVMIAGRYTLLNREAESELLPECERRGIGVLAAGAFNGGLIARGASAGTLYNYRPAPPAVLERLAALERAAAATGADLRAAAIQFVLRQPRRERARRRCDARKSRCARTRRRSARRFRTRSGARSRASATELRPDRP